METKLAEKLKAKHCRYKLDGNILTIELSQLSLGHAPISAKAIIKLVKSFYKNALCIVTQNPIDGIVITCDLGITP
jgi:hypothetical protein